MSKTPFHIDILLSVVDNFGDMGFACELMIAYESTFPGTFIFQVFTDNVEKVGEFFLRNKHLLGEYAIIPYETFVPESSSDIIFALFHFPLPKFHDERKRLILRVDYLSLDIAWTVQNESEHIASNKCTEIREIIPSPLSGGSGLIQHDFPHISREEWLKINNLPSSLQTKKWITMFIYGSITDRFDIHSFPDDVCIFALGGKPLKEENIIHLPFLSIDSYYTLLSLSDFNIVRGEVSFVQALQLRKPFLWDMYKEIGGLPIEQSEQFLDFGQFDERYRGFHALLNGQNFSKISASDIQYTSETFPESLSKNMQDTKNLAHETKKYIDRFYFSL